MREITVKLYQFDELSEEAKDKAREWARDDGGMKGQWAWDQVSEDAEQIGLKIIRLDDHRPNEGKFIKDDLFTLEAILKEHGEHCDTYKTALRYRKAIKNDKSFDEFGEETEELQNSRHEFLHDLLEDYRVMLNNDLEYAYSQEAIDEDIRANEYEFTEDGKRS